MKTLFIVESPGKKQKISKILGPSYNVQASFGHIRDLPSRQLGVDTETWRATYESKNDKAIKNLTAKSPKAREIQEISVA